MRNRIAIVLRNSMFWEVFNFRDDRAKGRSCMLISNLLLTVVNTLTTGIFYTGFLLANDISMVDIGVLGFIPFLTSLFSLFSPMILERFKRRKWLLTASRLAFYTLNIAGITLVPMLHLGKQVNYILFIILVFCANAINFLFTSGYSVWQVNFLPPQVRANYFSFQQIISGALSAVTVLISGFITDSVKQSGNQLQVMTIMRLLAFGVAIAEVLVLCLPREYEYAKSAKISIRSLITTPFHHHKFLLTMLIVFMWNFGTYLSLAAFDVYILDTVQVSYTMISAINAAYSVFLILFAPMWKRVLARHDWLKTFAIAALMHAPTVFLNSFVNPSNYFWLYTAMRLLQHFIGVGLNLTFANMAYVHLPEKDQTYCMSFFVLVTNVAAFTGQLTGTTFIAATPNLSIPLFGYSYSNVSVLVWAQTAVIIAVSIFILKIGPKLKGDSISN